MARRTTFLAVGALVAVLLLLAAAVLVLPASASDLQAPEKKHHGGGKEGKGHQETPPADPMVVVRVSMSMGRPIAGAPISLQGAQRYQATTDAFGFASFRVVPDGDYVLTVTVKGVEVYRRTLTVKRFTFVNVVVQPTPGPPPLVPPPAPGPQPPQANFSYQPTAPEVNQSIAFNGTASSDPDGQVVNYTWTFGDGIRGFGAVAQHAYQAPGRYNVTLQVADSGNLTSNATQVVNVTAPAGFQLSISIMTSDNHAVGDSRVSILDASLSVVFQASGPGTYSRTLPKGNYTVQAWGSGREFLGAKFVTLDSDKNVTFVQSSASPGPAIKLPPGLVLFFGLLAGLGVTAAAINVYLRRRGPLPPSELRPPPPP